MADTKSNTATETAKFTPRFTPGPWSMTHKRVIERPVRISEHFAVAPAAGPTLAFLPEGRADIQEANARAIATLPELWQFVRAFAETGTSDEVSGRWSADKMDEVIRYARVLMAKAEGRTS